MLQLHFDIHLFPSYYGRWMRVNVYYFILVHFKFFSTADEGWMPETRVRCSKLLYSNISKVILCAFVSTTCTFIHCLITVLLPVQCGGRKKSPRARNQCCYLFFDLRSNVVEVNGFVMPFGLLFPGSVWLDC